MLTASAESVAGKSDKVIVEAKTKIGTQEFTALTQPLELELLAP
jgi:hypothetical protein